MKDELNHNAAEMRVMKNLYMDEEKLAHKLRDEIKKTNKLQSESTVTIIIFIHLINYQFRKKRKISKTE